MELLFFFYYYYYYWVLEPKPGTSTAQQSCRAKHWNQWGYWLQEVPLQDFFTQEWVWVLLKLHNNQFFSLRDSGIHKAELAPHWHQNQHHTGGFATDQHQTVLTALTSETVVSQTALFKPLFVWDFTKTEGLKTAVRNHWFKYANYRDFTIVSILSFISPSDSLPTVWSSCS